LIGVQASIDAQGKPTVKIAFQFFTKLGGIFNIPNIKVDKNQQYLAIYEYTLSLTISEHIYIYKIQEMFEQANPEPLSFKIENKNLLRKRRTISSFVSVGNKTLFTVVLEDLHSILVLEISEDKISQSHVLNLSYPYRINVNLLNCHIKDSFFFLNENNSLIEVKFKNLPKKLK
jgi:hypothetical protein